METKLIKTILRKENCAYAINERSMNIIDKSQK